MAAQRDNMVDVLNALRLTDDEQQQQPTPPPDDGVRAKLIDLKRNHESVFSWDIYERTGTNTALLTDMLVKLRSKCDMIRIKDNAFDLDRFNLKLMISFELFVNNKRNESLREIEDIVDYVSLSTFDEANKEYSNAVSHIALSTHAYIALSMNLDCEKIFKNIKSINYLNKKEKSAICAIKAYVFMKYPPNGNDIALELAEEACNLNPEEPEWVLIWLKAKGRVRRYYKKNECPDDSEIDAMELIIKFKKQKSKYFNFITSIYAEKALYYKFEFNNRKECTKYYWLALNYLKKAILLLEDEDDVIQLSRSFRNYIHFPKQFQSLPQIGQIVEKLQRLNYSYVDFILGKYFMKIEKNYEQAKIYYTRALNTEGTFACAMELFNVECLLHAADGNFAFVETLNMIYDSFLNPRRLIILSQIMIYYYFEDNPKEVMRYLKLYMDQDINYENKKEQLSRVHPFPYHYKSKMYYKKNQLMHNITIYVNSIKDNYEWNSEEKLVVKDTLERFNQMLRSCASNDKVDGDEDNVAHKSYENRGNEECFIAKPQSSGVGEKSSWRKKQDLSATPRNICFEKGSSDRRNVTNKSPGSSDPDESNRLAGSHIYSNKIFGSKRTYTKFE